MQSMFFDTCLQHLVVESCSVCRRLAKGKNLDVLCKGIRRKLALVKNTELLQAFKRWSWTVTMQTVYQLAQVSWPSTVWHMDWHVSACRLHDCFSAATFVCCASEEVLAHMCNAMQALADVHPSRAHRDLKLDNIMIAEYFGSHASIKLLDWANSRASSEGTCSVTQQYQLGHHAHLGVSCFVWAVYNIRVQCTAGCSFQLFGQRLQS